MELRSRIRVSTVIFIPTIIVGLNGLMIFLMIRGFYLHLQNIFRVFLCGSIVMLVVDTMIVTYFYTLLIRTRRQVRYEYNIPVEGFGEDALYSIFCAPCAITQMGQHTADYSTYVATCCTDTGLSRHIELKFPNDLVAEQV
jgi:Cys-rich protein (TIGR01571 family)